MRNQKRKSLIRNTAVLALGLMAVWGFNTALFPALSSEAEPGSSASSEVGINVKESIKIAIDKDNLVLEDGNGNTQIAPEASGTLITGDVNVAVTTNAYKGYTVSVYTADSTKAMRHNNTSVSTAIDSIDTVSGYDASTGASDLSANTWGFRKYISGMPSNWFAVGASSSNAAIIDTKSVPNSDYCDSLEYPLNTSDCTGDTYDTYQIGFGAKLNTALPAGTYTNNIVFSAITNEGTRYLTFNANALAGTTVSGSMAPKSIFSGADVTLPAGGFSRIGYGVKGWALTSGATEVATVSGTALTPGATVSVDELAMAAGQSVSATTPIALYAVWDNQYNFAYVANNPAETSVTGTTASNTGVLGLNTTISDNGYEIEGYNFLGWAFTADAGAVAQVSGEDLVSGATFDTSALVAAANTAGQSVSTVSSGTVKLYGVWEIDIRYMQDFSCNDLAVGETDTLVDRRDDSKYTVKKIGSKCWMTSDLILGHDKGYALTKDDTNIPNDDNTTYYLPPAGYSGSITSSSTLTSTTTATFEGGNDNQAQVQYRAAGQSGDRDSTGTILRDIGYYNFYTATLGCSYYNAGSSCRSGYVQKDICPKGWKLPTNGSYSTDYTWSSLDYALNPSASSVGFNRTDITSRDNFLNNASFDGYGGYFGGSQLRGVGLYGNWWSSTVSDSTFAYLMALDSSGGVNPQLARNKFCGFSVRCVATQ